MTNINKQNNESFLSGSSETTGKAPFYKNSKFDDFYTYGQASHVPRISQEFLEWFIGFFEGEGSFISDNTLDKRNNRVGTRLRVSLCQKEKRILEIIQKTFGFGSLHCWERNQKTYWRWSVDSKKSVEALAYLFSGHLSLGKRQKRFLEWIEFGQRKGMFQEPFQIKPWAWEANIHSENAWFCGFVDGEGCFTVSKQLPKIKALKNSVQKIQEETNKNISIKLKLLKSPTPMLQSLEVAQVGGQEEKQVLQALLFLFGNPNKKVCKKTRKFSSLQKNSFDELGIEDLTNQLFSIKFASYKSLELIINYFDKYPLRTNKKFAYIRWKKVFFIRKEGYKNGLLLSERALKRFEKLAYLINKTSKKREENG
jgi:hypothetical protein